MTRGRKHSCVGLEFMLKAEGAWLLSIFCLKTNCWINSVFVLPGNSLPAYLQSSVAFKKVCGRKRYKGPSTPL